MEVGIFYKSEVIKTVKLARMLNVRERFVRPFFRGFIIPVAVLVL